MSTNLFNESHFKILRKCQDKFDCLSIFHLPKNSGNSGRVVNGTRLFGSFHWKFSGINGIPEKVVPFSRWKLPNGKFVVHLQSYCLITSSMPFAVYQGARPP